MAERIKTRNELGFRIEREREGEERNDWKTWEKVIGGCNLWILVLAGNERHQEKDRCATGATLHSVAPVAL